MQKDHAIKAKTILSINWLDVNKNLLGLQLFEMVIFSA